LLRSLEGGVALVAVAGGRREGGAGASGTLIVGSIHASRGVIRALAHVLGELTVAVRPDWQGRGVGRALLERLLAVVRDGRPEIERVELLSRESNARAIRLYERAGFRREGRMQRRIRAAGGELVADVPMAWLRGEDDAGQAGVDLAVVQRLARLSAPPVAGLAGVDGAPEGWIAVVDRGDGSTGVRLERSFGALLERADLRGIVVDVPIGLVERGSRQADQAARRRLKGRSSCVFDAPIRGILDETSHTDASARRRQLEEKGFSIQAWAIVPKVREVDALMRGEPGLQERVREGHPEVTFCLMNGDRPVTPGKGRRAGREERLRLLRAVFGDEVERWRGRFPGMWTDVLDAFAMLWTARRVAAGVHLTLPGDVVETDAFGLRAEMVA
jgi:predicted RNase H-like nuclease/GNAT superfamily N-acetyltransferase